MEVVAVLPGRKMMMINFSPELGLVAGLPCYLGRTGQVPLGWAARGSLDHLTGKIRRAGPPGTWKKRSGNARG